MVQSVVTITVISNEYMYSHLKWRSAVKVTYAERCPAAAAVNSGWKTAEAVDWGKSGCVQHGAADGADGCNLRTVTVSANTHWSSLSELSSFHLLAARQINSLPFLHPQKRTSGYTYRTMNRRIRIHIVNLRWRVSTALTNSNRRPRVNWHWHSHWYL